MHFRIEVEGLDEGGAASVILPEARIAAADAARTVHYGMLVLRRGVTRSRSWYAWWDQARTSHGLAPKTVAVTLLDARGDPVHRWAFARAEPVAYRLSALDALGNEPLFETLELGVRGFTLD